MKNKLQSFLLLLVFAGLLPVLNSGCKKDEKDTLQIPVIITTSVSNITSTSAVGAGLITSDGGKPVTARGFCWSTNNIPTIADSKTSAGSGIGIFSSSITGLSQNTTYYLRAYATNDNGTGYGEILPITTLNIVLPVVTTAPITGIQYLKAVGGGEVISDGFKPVTARGVCWSTTNNPTTSDSHTTDGQGLGSFTSTLQTLDTGIIYYVRAYAINANGTAYGNEVQFSTLDSNAFSCGFSTIHDFDGNVYNTVLIGNQCWMKENLKATHYSNGTEVSLITESSEWSAMNASNKAYCYYDNSASKGAIYGALYTWAAATNGVSSTATPSGVQGICPNGWHIPSDNEWKQLEVFLGMTQAQAEELNWRGTDQGAKLKAITTLWYDPNAGATNSSGFTAIPGGFRNYNNGSFSGLGYYGKWWTTTYTSYVYDRELGYNETRMNRTFYNLEYTGYSVRCVKN
jgi:uncharacterized protein (TIGR02145 family)